MSEYGSPEEYARFLRKRFLKNNNTRVATDAFMPSFNEKNNRLEVSCFEVQGLNQSQIIDIAVNNSISPNNKAPAAYSVIFENEFPKEKIQIDKNYNPLRHIDLIGWEKYNSKELQKQVAMELAEISSKNIHLLEF